MKEAQSNKTIAGPTSWDDIPYGANYHQALDQSLKAWWPKMFGFHLLKIGALSTYIDTRDCTIPNQVNVGLEGKFLQVIADLYQLPFANKSIDACLLAHTLSYTNNPLRLLREVDRILINDGWLVITTFNPVSMLGLSKICSILFRCQPYRSKMYTQMRLLTWLGVLNFEVLHNTHLQVLPWRSQTSRLLITHLPVVSCLNVIVARKRTLLLSLKPLKNKASTLGLWHRINATTSCYQQ